MRLTLRSAQDGRFLARVVDPGGFPFVLDFGDERVIADLTQRLLHGFTMWRHGKLENVAPQSEDIMPLLADYYCNEGMLVFLEEPMWPGRDHSLEDRLPGPESPSAPAGTQPEDGVDLSTDEAFSEESSTEVVDISDTYQGVIDLEEFEAEDEPTEVVVDERKTDV